MNWKKTTLTMMTAVCVITMGSSCVNYPTAQGDDTSRSEQHHGIPVEKQQEIIDAAVLHVQEYRSYIISQPVVSEVNSVTSDEQDYLSRDITNLGKFAMMTDLQKNQVVGTFEKLFSPQDNYAGYEGLSPEEKLALGTALSHKLTKAGLSYGIRGIKSSVVVNKQLVFFDPSDNTVVFPGTSINTKLGDKRVLSDEHQTTVVLEADGKWRIDPTPLINEGYDLHSGKNSHTSTTRKPDS